MPPPYREIRGGKESAGARNEHFVRCRRILADTSSTGLESAQQAPNIVTNPPFKLATAFVKHALQMVCVCPGDPAGRKVAMLLKVPYLEGVERTEVFDNAGFARLHVFRRRVSFLRGGVEPLSMNGRGGMIAYGWFVWEIGYTGAPTLHWLEGAPCK